MIGKTPQHGELIAIVRTSSKGDKKDLTRGGLAVPKLSMKDNEHLRYAGRMSSEEAALALGFKAHDVPILVREGLMRPLGDPPANATKYFAATYIQRLAVNESWLAKATKCLNAYWTKHNKERRDRSIIPA
jgi:hypothetical protein